MRLSQWPEKKFFDLLLARQTLELPMSVFAHNERTRHFFQQYERERAE